ncbi:MAG: hypothetical protein KAV83_04055 [Desulfobacterales bacterium]|nr:hypothetical protein [Desulfobacterales bacterium]
MARWKKTGNSCPHCGYETEVLVGAMGEHDSVRSVETCWGCGWVAGSDKEEGKPEDMVRMLNEKETAKN